MNLVSIAQLAACLIRMIEGFKGKAYWDATGKKWTIGFGHTAGVTEGMTCTFEQAVAWMVVDMKPLLTEVEGLPLYKAAALVSFGYNLGLGALRRYLRGDFRVTLEGFFTRDTNQAFGRVSGGVLLEGLAARRALEAAMILSCESPTPPVPKKDVVN